MKMILRIGNKNSFTLVELLIVVCILLVIAGISLPIFSKTFDNISLSNSANNMVYFMRFAHFRAISEGLYYRINFKADSNSYYLTFRSGKDYKKINDKLGRERHLPKKIKLDSELKFIDFMPNGQTIPFKITLMNSLKKRISIVNAGDFFNVAISKS